MNKVHGAQKENWLDLVAICGLKEDLIPVVSNPDLTISAGSNMRQVGKTPSKLNGRGDVAGFSNWTQHVADSDDIERWSSISDYGICIQTRNVRGLDIDTPDPEEAENVKKFIAAFLKKAGAASFATRYRGNSSKFLIPIAISGIPEDEDLYKRTFKTEKGLVEFLATGQQFVAYGRHPSGAMYEWDNEFDFPEISLELFEELWERLNKRFGTGESTSAAPRKRGDILAGSTDRIIEQLEDAGMVLGYGKDGQAHITCPFEHEHSGTESVVSSTSYFPAGTGGYANGHYVCLHAHCADRTDQDFMDGCKVDVMPRAELAALSEDSPAYDAPKDPAFKRSDSGEILPTVKNVMMALETPHISDFHIAKDTFLEEITLAPYDEKEIVGAAPWRNLEDEDYIELRTHLESAHFFKPLNTGIVKDCLHAVARRHKYDSLEEFAKNLEWDGVPRVEKFFTEYVVTKDKEFGVAVAKYLFSALAGRAIQAGIKADMMPILIGDQSLRKTSAIEFLAPHEELFCEMSLSADEDKRVRMIKGTVLAEIGEMRGMYGAQMEDIKAFITKRHDRWIPKYKEQAINYARRTIFIGTGNHYDILNDSTGNRRFLPMSVLSIDADAIKRDHIQLWAEGKFLFEKNGIMWQDAEALCWENNKQYEAIDPWQEIIAGWLAEEDTDGKTIMDNREGITTGEILVSALGLHKGATNSGNGKKVGEIMRSLGYIRKRLRVGHSREYFWVEKEGSA